MLEGCTPWPAAFADRYRREGYWQGITLMQMLEGVAARHPAKDAVVHGDRRISYTELYEEAERLAAGLAGLGLEPLDRVIFQLANGPEFIAAFFALARIGVIPVMALPAHRHTEIGHFVAHASAVAYLIPAVYRRFDFRDMAEDIRAASPSLRHVIVAGEAGPGQVELDELRGGRLDSPHPPADEVALMLLSGGTTALPKLIPRTHNDYVYACQQSGRIAGFSEKTVFLAALPMAHNYLLASPGILGVLAHGGTVVVASATDAATVFPLIAAERVTAVAAAGPLATEWLSAPAPDPNDVSSVELVMCGGARLAPDLRRRLQDLLGCTYQENFGMSEGLLSICRLDADEARRFESSGAPISPADEIRIVDEAGHDLPDGTAGELQCRGPYTVRGYYCAPDINRAAFTADGFYRTGDLVRRVDGYIYVEGRLKDLINRGGEKISCGEVEGHLLAHDKVKSACLVAMPDEIYGERACAFVIPKDGATVTLDEVKAFLSTRGIAKFKWPERLELVEAFPMSAAGKILRRELKAQIAATLAAETTATAPRRP